MTLPWLFLSVRIHPLAAQARFDCLSFNWTAVLSVESELH